MEKISIIIPAYNEAERIKQTLQEVLSFLEDQKMDAEVLVIDDGSKDNTAKVARQIKDPRLLVLAYRPNQGKGFAIRTGVKNATGDVIVFVDADHSISIEHIREFLPRLKEYDIVIGSKALKTTEKIKSQKRHREFLGRCFNFLVRIITGIRFRDTQCGFKLFKKGPAKKIFSKMKVRRFSFDVEALYLAKKFNYRVKEMPIILTERENSRVSIVFDSLYMLKDVIMIRVRDFSGKYR